MAMTSGSVSVAADGTVTKSGFAGSEYDAELATWTALAGPGVVPSLEVKKNLAAQANRQARIITYLQGNAQAFIKPSSDGAPSDGLQKASGTPTTAPDAAKYLSIV